jgi:hypothetical protein
MARVEITQNRGPEVITSVDEEVPANTNNFFSRIVAVRLYTLHSYQVMSESEDIDFTIIASNVVDVNGEPSNIFDKDWTVISNHTVTASLPFGYSDVWNFNFSCALIKNFSNSPTQVKILEKHNA